MIIMRQRISKIPSRGGSSTWDMGADDECDSLPGNMYPQAVPTIYNVPYNHPHHQVVVNPPRSYPPSWQKSMYSAPDPVYHPSAPDIWSEKKSDALPSLAPSFIPDGSYQSYLRTGRSSRRQNNKGGGGAHSITKVCCAKFCAGFSFVAVGFLLFVGIIFDTQPLYIPGSLPKHVQYIEGSTSKTQVFYSLTPSVRLLPASNAYGAALVYLITGCACLVYAYDLITCYRRKSYEDIPDTDSMIPNFHLPTRSSSMDYLLPTTISPTRGRPYYYPRGTIPDSFLETSRSYYNRAKMFIASMWHADDYRRTRKRKADPKEV